jgi:hypothetical protein
MANQLRLKYNDFDGTSVTTSIAVQDEAYATQAAKLDTLTTQLELWGIGRLHSRDDIRNIVDNGPGSATSPAAQDSLMLILEIEDTNTGVIYREKFPMPDLSNAADGGSNAAWITQGQGNQSLTVMNPLHSEAISLKAAYDAVGVSPEGNDAVLRRAYIEK